MKYERLQNIVNQLVVCQLVLRTEPESTVDQIKDISIQCLNQFLGRQTAIHLQECQCNLTFRSKEGLPASLCSQILRLLLYQHERYRHLSKRAK